MTLEGTRVLVAGATGTLGSALVDSLLRRGAVVDALGRDQDKLNELQRRGVRRAHRGDVTRPETLQGVCEDVDTVVSAVGLVGLRAMTSRQTHKEVDLRGNLNLLREADSAGVRKFVYVSMVGAGDKGDVPLLEAKGGVEAALRRSGLEWLIVRPTVLFEQMDQGILQPARKGLVVLVGDGRTKVQPVDARDLADWMTDRLHESGRAIEVGGPQVHTYDEAAHLAFDAIGKPERLLHVSPALVDAGAKLVRPLPAATYGELTFLRYALTHDLVGEPAGARDLAQHWGAGGEGGRPQL